MEENKNSKLIIICMGVVIVALIIALIVFGMNNNNKQADRTANTSTEIQTNTAVTNNNVVTNNNNQDSNNESSNNSYISKEKAQEIALQHAGVSASNTSKLKVELGHEDGKEVYEVDFKSGNMEYDYDIDPKTGNIIKSDNKIDD